MLLLATDFAEFFCGNLNIQTKLCANIKNRFESYTYLFPFQSSTIEFIAPSEYMLRPPQVNLPIDSFTRVASLQ